MTGDGDGDVRAVSPDELKDFAKRVLVSAGLGEDDATVLADCLGAANLRGVDSHGMLRLPAYARKVIEGGFAVDPDISTTRVGQAAFVVDGDDGPGQLATLAAMDAVVDAAASTGVAVATVVNSNHFGRAAYYTRKAAAADCLGIAMTNVGPNVAPYGGTEPYFGTNPFAYSIPTDRDVPITLDVATSVVAKGKVVEAAAEGQSIPDHWAIDESGQPTTDPDVVHALRPVGGHKGYGLGLLVDVCSGLLSGMGPSPDVDSLNDDYARPQRIGHFVAAIDVATFRDPDAFRADVEALIEGLHSVPPADGFDRVRVPGEPEAETLERRRRDGIPIPSGLGGELQELADRHDVPVPWDRYQ